MASTTPKVLSAREILNRLVAFPTVSRDTNLPLVDWVQTYLDAHGIDSHRVMSPCGEKAHLYAHLGPDTPGGVVLSGHTDVVPIDGQDWSTDPWTVVEKDGKLYGRGTCDMKGFDALALHAFVEASKRPLTRPLQLAFSYDEEVGCMAVIELIEAMIGADMPRAQSVLVGEPSMMQVVTGHKGGIGYKVDVAGFEVHSSLQPYGVSAIHDGIRLIQWANDRNDELAAATPTALAAPFDPPYSTLHVGTISGGTANNITAKTCQFWLGVRAVPGEPGWAEEMLAAGAAVDARMKAVRPEAGLEMTKVMEVPPLTPEDRGSAEQLARRLTGDNGEHVVSYGTEGGQFQVRGYSVVVCGPGDIAQAHQPDEFVSVAQFKAGEAFMQRLLDDLCA